MSSSDGGPLHLPSLSIEGFRGIKRLWLPKLGRATLPTGRNGVGKTTVLEAARIWAARGTSASIGNVPLRIFFFREAVGKIFGCLRDCPT